MSWRTPGTGKLHRALVIRDNQGREVMIEHPKSEDLDPTKFEVNPMKILVDYFLDVATGGSSDAKDYLDKYHIQILLSED